MAIDLGTPPSLVSPFRLVILRVFCVVPTARHFAHCFSMQVPLNACVCHLERFQIPIPSAIQMYMTFCLFGNLCMAALRIQCCFGVCLSHSFARPHRVNRKRRMLEEYGQHRMLAFLVYIHRSYGSGAVV